MVRLHCTHAVVDVSGFWLTLLMHHTCNVGVLPLVHSHTCPKESTSKLFMFVLAVLAVPTLFKSNDISVAIVSDDGYAIPEQLSLVWCDCEEFGVIVKKLTRI